MTYEDVVRMVESDNMIVYAEDIKSCGDCPHEDVLCPGWAAYNKESEKDLPCFSWRRGNVVSTTGGRQ